jgi:hypothetical protein
MLNYNKIEGKRLTISTVRAMIKMLNNALVENHSLAKDIFLFLKNKNIDIPIINKTPLDKLVTKRYTAYKSDKTNFKLKNAFEGVSSFESIM